ncbi:MAG: methyltransferase domain-containing protein [Candidatus Hinthialibacter antarcticus]|nr:methyltransferase domain-containing protein [Candidatus Hinthialibacter antarcticus]
MNTIQFRIGYFVLSLILCLAVAAQEKHQYNPEQFEKGERSEWQQVDKVIEALQLKPGMRVADIGGGSGYFSRPIAKAVGEKGVVYICDLAVNLMEFLQDKAKEENLHNIVTVLAAMDRPMLPPKSVDLIFFCNTNHHLSNRVEYYQGLHSLLRDGGRIAVVDWNKKDQKVGPPASHNHARVDMISEMKEAGFIVAREETFLDYQYFVFFEPAK